MANLKSKLLVEGKNCKKRKYLLGINLTIIVTEFQPKSAQKSKLKRKFRCFHKVLTCIVTVTHVSCCGAHSTGSISHHGSNKPCLTLNWSNSVVSSFWVLQVRHCKRCTGPTYCRAIPSRTNVVKNRKINIGRLKPEPNFLRRLLVGGIYVGEGRMRMEPFWLFGPQRAFSAR
jgi:hypothetical protein